MDPQKNFRQLIQFLCDRLTSDNLSLIRYLCKDIIPDGFDLPTPLEVFEYFENRSLIDPEDVSFVAEILYRINRQDLLKRLPNVKNRRDYEEHFLKNPQNFTAFRIACLKLIDELTSSDFQTMRSLCKGKLSNRNYQRSTDVITLLVCLEEEDFMSDGDLEFILNCLRPLRNQIPFQIFERLSQGDHSITLPKCHQSLPNMPSHSAMHSFPPYSHSPSMPHLPKHDFKTPQIFQPHNNYLSSQGTTTYHDLNTDNASISMRSAIESDWQSENETQALSSQKIFDSYPFVSGAGRTFSEQDSTSKVFTNPPTQSLAAVEDFSREMPCQRNSASPEPHPDSHTTPMKSVVTTLADPLTSVSYEGIAHDQPLENMPDTDCTSARYALPTLADVGEFHQNNPPIRPVAENRLEDIVYSQLQPTVASKTPQRGAPQPLECYKMDNVLQKKPTGYCLIINNFTFEGEVNQEEALRRLRLPDGSYEVPNVGLKDREGSQKDAKRFAELFESFGFLIEKHENLDSRKMCAILQELSEKDHSNYNAFVAVVMSHGLQGCVYGTDGQKVSLTQIQKFFKPQKCSSLVNKPKIFFYQACQGDKLMHGHTYEACGVAPSDDIETDSSDPSYVSTPNEADFLIGHSTVPGFMSYRSRIHGSWYIGTLIDSLEKYHATEDLLSIMVKVNGEIASKPMKQMSMPITTLRKKIFFLKAPKEISLPDSQDMNIEN